MWFHDGLHGFSVADSHFPKDRARLNFLRPRTFVILALCFYVFLRR